jgi:hypothetical protein
MSERVQFCSVSRETAEAKVVFEIDFLQTTELIAVRYMNT